MKKNDKIIIVFFNESILTCIDLPFVLRDDFTASLIMNAFEAVMQSYQIQYLNIKDFLKANVQKQTMPLGSPSIKINNNILTQFKDNSIQEFCNKKNSIIKVLNYDNNCLLIAILIAIAYLHDESYKKEYKKYNNK
jgi:hypothetical protein